MNRKLEVERTGQDKQLYRKSQSSLLKLIEASQQQFLNQNQDLLKDRLFPLGLNDKSIKRKTQRLTIDLLKLLKKKRVPLIMLIVCNSFEIRFKD